LFKFKDYLLPAAVWALASACSGPQSSEKGTNASKQGASFSPQTPKGGGIAPKGGTFDGTATNPPATQPAARPPEQMSQWCAAVVTTEIAKKPSHMRQLANLCTTQNVPTKVFASLVAQAYAGTGKPSITSITDIVAKNGQVSWSYGSAIKLPVDAKTHFEKAAPNQGDEALQEQSLIADGAQTVAVTSTPIASSQDKSWVRGWTMAQDWSKSIFILTIRTTYDYLVNHYNLQNNLYLYAQTFGSGKSTVRNNELVSALLELNGSAYLVAIGEITVDDQGFPSQAAESVVTTVERNIKQVYEQSKVAK